MSWRHGLFLLWLIATLVWLIGWMILVGMSCHPLVDGQLSCRTVSHHWIGEWISRTTWTYLGIAFVGVALPAIVLAVGEVLTWAVAALRPGK